MLPDGSRAGVWIFGEDVQQIVPHRVIDARWRRQAQEAVEAIDNSGQRTNIPAALAAATYDLERMDPSFRTSIVLLTDGKVDVAESPVANASAARTVLAEVAPELGATGIPIHTIALSDDADWAFLRELAGTTTGLAGKAESAGELTTIFLQSLEMVAPTARVPVASDRLSTPHAIGTSVDQAIPEPPMAPLGAGVQFWATARQLHRARTHTLRREETILSSRRSRRTGATRPISSRGPGARCRNDPAA